MYSLKTKLGRKARNPPFWNFFISSPSLPTPYISPLSSPLLISLWGHRCAISHDWNRKEKDDEERKEEEERRERERKELEEKDKRKKWR